MRSASFLIALSAAALPLACGSSNATPAPVVDAGPLDSAAPPAWTTQRAARTSTLAAVWGSGPADVYAVGYSPGAIVHSVDRSVTWSETTLDDATELLAVGGSGPDDVYVAGIRGPFKPLVMHSADRGATWQTSDLAFVGGARAIWSSGPTDTYVVGDSTSGAVIARTSDRGATWTLSTVAQAAGLSGIWGTGPNDVYIAGARATPSDPGPNDAGSNDAGGARTEGVVLHSTDGGHTWTVVTTTPTGGLFAVAGSADGARIDAVGGGYTLTESTDHGATWVQHAGNAALATQGQLTAVWMSSATGMPYIAAGAHGLLRTVDGVDSLGISSIVESLPESIALVFGVWGTADEVYAVGTGGEVAHRIGAE